MHWGIATKITSDSWCHLHAHLCQPQADTSVMNYDAETADRCLLHGEDSFPKSKAISQAVIAHDKSGCRVWSLNTFEESSSKRVDRSFQFYPCFIQMCTTFHYYLRQFSCHMMCQKYVVSVSSATNSFTCSLVLCKAWPATCLLFPLVICFCNSVLRAK